MEPITFTMANELSMIPVVQAAAAAYCRAIGAGGEIAGQMELVIEEIVTNILQYEYLPDQRETITLTLSLQENVLELLIRFRGIPFDVARLKQCEKKTGIDQIIESEGRGVGLRLLGQLSDEVTYRNLGWQGQEIRIRRFVSGTERTAPARAEVRREEELTSGPQRTAVRRMHPEEAAKVAQLAYFSYRYTYFYEFLYDPDEIRKRNADGRMLSYLAVSEESGEILGHLAAIPDDLSGMTELGAGFVNPHYRGSGAFNALVDAINGELLQQGIQGVFGTAVTTHSYSQMSAVKQGWKETALLVSRLSPLAFQAIRDRENSRESLLYLCRLFDLSPRRPYYPPARHCEMIAAIGRNADMDVTLAANSATISLPDRGCMEEKTVTSNDGLLIVRQWGNDSEAAIRTVLKRWCLDRLETVYLYLPLFEPATAVLGPACEDMEFFFAGIKPGRDGQDWLVLQYLNNQRYDYRDLRAATPFGKALIDYVWSCDPNAGGTPVKV